MQRYFKTLKVELVYPQRYATRAQVRLDIVSWMEGFCNAQRLHSSTAYMAPIDANGSLMAQ